METLNIEHETRNAQAIEAALAKAVEMERREAATVAELEAAAAATEGDALDAIIAAARDETALLIEGTASLEHAARQWCNARDEATDALDEQRRRLIGAQLEVVRLGRAARRARGRVTLARTLGGVPATYAEIGAVVEAAIAKGEGLTLDLDGGLTTMGGEDLAQWWADLVPGEGVELVGIHGPDDDQEAATA